MIPFYSWLIYFNILIRYKFGILLFSFRYAYKNDLTKWKVPRFQCWKKYFVSCNKLQISLLYTLVCNKIHFKSNVMRLYKHIRIHLISNSNMRLDIYNYWSTLKEMFLTSTKFEWHLASFWLSTFDKEIMALKYCLWRVILESQHDSSNHIKIL